MSVKMTFNVMLMNLGMHRRFFVVDEIEYFLLRQIQDV